MNQSEPLVHGIQIVRMKNVAVVVQNKYQIKMGYGKAANIKLIRTNTRCGVWQNGLVAVIVSLLNALR